MPIKEGSVIGNCRVIRQIGRGGTGEVYLARHCTLDNEVAVKVLKPEVAVENPEFVGRFMLEARLSARLRHANIVSVHDAGKDEQTGLYYIVMDYVSGGTARDVLRRKGRLPVGQALKIVRQVARALQEGEKLGLVHRDIKPENIMFASDGRALLADLGIAKTASADMSENTMTRSVFGTPAYMSPEQARDSSRVDGRSDIYSLGIVLYELLVGSRPYAQKSAVELMAQLADPTPIPVLPADVAPTPVVLLVAAMCEKDVLRRIQSATELVDRIDAILANADLSDASDEQATVVSDMVSTWRKLRMLDDRLKRMLLELLASFVLFVSIGFVLSWVQRSPKGQKTEVEIMQEGVHQYE